MQVKNNFTGQFIYTLVTSGIVYMLTYLIAVSKPTNEGAAVSLLVGFMVYLAVRLKYKKGEDFDKLSAKAYRLIVWMVPLSLITVHLIFFFINPGDEPQFKGFYSADDLLWSGPFVIMIWPIVNAFVLIGNAVTLLWMLVYYFGMPVFIGLTALVLLTLFIVLKKIVALKNESIIEFSLSLAVVLVLTPIVTYAFCVYRWL